MCNLHGNHVASPHQYIFLRGKLTDEDRQELLIGSNSIWKTGRSSGSHHIPNICHLVITPLYIYTYIYFILLPALCVWLTYKHNPWPSRMVLLDIGQLHDADNCLVNSPRTVLESGQSDWQGRLKQDMFVVHLILQRLPWLCHGSPSPTNHILQWKFSDSPSLASWHME